MVSSMKSKPTYASKHFYTTNIYESYVFWQIIMLQKSNQLSVHMNWEDWGTCMIVIFKGSDDCLLSAYVYRSEKAK